MARIEPLETEARRDNAGDARRRVEKHRAISDWDVPDIDRRAADTLFLTEVTRAVDAIRADLLGSRN